MRGGGGGGGGVAEAGQAEGGGRGEGGGGGGQGGCLPRGAAAGPGGPAMVTHLHASGEKGKGTGKGTGKAGHAAFAAFRRVNGVSPFPGKRAVRPGCRGLAFACRIVTRPNLAGRAMPLSEAH